MSLNELIELFIERHPEYVFPYEARGCCGLATKEFIDLAKRHGIEAHAALFRLDRGEWDIHWMVDAGDVFVDFTARQFGLDQPYPLIVTREFAERNFFRRALGLRPEIQKA